MFWKRIPARFKILLDALRASLWALPALFAAGAVVVASGMLLFDRARTQSPSDLWWPLAAGPEGTRATLSSVAGSVMTVAGVSFSMTVVVLQLASTQYSPRVVQNFRRDRLIQLVFAAYLGTFVYTLIVLRTINSAQDGPPFTAPISVSLGLIFALICMILLVVLVHHVARTVQVSTILDSIATETRSSIEGLYPERVGRAVEPVPPPEPPGDEPWRVRAARSGFVEAIDPTTFAQVPGLRAVHIAVCVGDFVAEGDTVARAWPSPRDRATAERVTADAFSIASERTVYQDVRFGFRLIADVALRALSPAVNDPTTAVHCVRVAGALLNYLASRALPQAVRKLGEDLVIVAPRPTFQDVAHVALEEVISAGAASAAVQAAVLRVLEGIVERQPAPSDLAALLRLVSRVSRSLEGSAIWEDDRARLRATVVRLLAPELSEPKEGTADTTKERTVF